MTTADGTAHPAGYFAEEALKPSLDGRTAVITMTLTSAACPLTGVLEDQIRAGLVPLSCVDDFRVDWQWIPAWRPADITGSGREQLRAIGFTV
jgi:metal-sulfur cluster biosynthetic enzyme